MYSAKRLIHELHSNAWLISPKTAEAFLPRIVQLMTGQPVAWDDEDDRNDDPEARLKTQPLVYTRSGAFVGKGSASVASAPDNSVTVIPVLGPIMKNDSCGDAGTMTLAKWVEDSASNPKISAIILKVDSPGGTVSGTQTLSDAIQKARLSKPVVAFIEEGMMASAAYWIGSNADEIIASQATDEIGSIGVYTQMADFSKYYEEKGITVKDIYAPQSTQKNEDYRHFQKTGEGSGHLVDGLSFIADRFIKVVEANRAGKLNTKAGDPFKGRLYNAEEALQIGLIDSIGSMQSAINRSYELADSRKGASASNNQSPMKFKETLKAVGAVLGIVTVRELTEEDWNTVDQALTERNAQIETLTANAATAATDIENLRAQVAALTTERDNLQATVAAYGNKPGATHTNPNKPEDVIESSAASDAQKLIDDLPHNRKADEMGTIVPNA